MPVQMSTVVMRYPRLVKTRHDRVRQGYKPRYTHIVAHCCFGFRPRKKHQFTQSSVGTFPLAHTDTSKSQFQMVLHFCLPSLPLLTLFPDITEASNLESTPYFQQLWTHESHNCFPSRQSPYMSPYIYALWVSVTHCCVLNDPLSHRH